MKALPNQQTIDYLSWKLVLVGNGGTGIILDYVALWVLLHLGFSKTLFCVVMGIFDQGQVFLCNS